MDFRLLPAERHAQTSGRTVQRRGGGAASDEAEETAAAHAGAQALSSSIEHRVRTAPVQAEALSSELTHDVELRLRREARSAPPADELPPAHPLQARDARSIRPRGPDHGHQSARAAQPPERHDRGAVRRGVQRDAAHPRGAERDAAVCKAAKEGLLRRRAPHDAQGRCRPARAPRRGARRRLAGGRGQGRCHAAMSGRDEGGGGDVFSERAKEKSMEIPHCSFRIPCGARQEAGVGARRSRPCAVRGNGMALILHD